jgi:divalent metal cation (Fe/Co/Zn/Cd) transporter
METIIQTIVVILFFALAIWYLYRRFRAILNPNQSSCGCGCSGCSPEPKPAPKIENADEKNT